MVQAIKHSNVEAMDGLFIKQSSSYPCNFICCRQGTQESNTRQAWEHCDGRFLLEIPDVGQWLSKAFVMCNVFPGSGRAG